MNETDFWNLAGRAGRLGKEFQGNIICVDPRRADVWASPPPVRRSTYAIKPATDSIFDDFGTFLEYLAEQAPVDVALKHPEYDQLLSYLLSQFDVDTGLEDLPACASLTQSNRDLLASEVKKIADGMTLPLDIVHRNPGISPFAMQKLLSYFQGRMKPVEELLPVLPESEDAVQIFNNIFGRINSHVAPVFAPASRTFALAILVVNWMRGYSLARMIGSRIAYFDQKDRVYELASMIRSVMDDVEQVARFTAPRYLSCYLDVLRHHLSALARDDLLDQIPDVNLWLEFGASQITQLSLMGLGLSRTTAIAVSEFIADDSLSQDQALERLKELAIDTMGLPLAIVRELKQLIGMPENV